MTIAFIELCKIAPVDHYDKEGRQKRQNGKIRTDFLGVCAVYNMVHSGHFEFIIDYKQFDCYKILNINIFLCGWLQNVRRQCLRNIIRFLA